MFLYYSALLNRVSIFLSLIVSFIVSVTLYHFCLNIRQGFHIFHVTAYPPHPPKTSSTHWILPSRSQLCCNMSRIVKDAAVELFHNDSTMLDLRICNRKTELHGGSEAISITLFCLVYFLS